jgi:hypothetical protein
LLQIPPYTLDIDVIKSEIKLQQIFSKRGLAPYITDTFRYLGNDSSLAVNCGTTLDTWGIEKLFLDEDDIDSLGSIYLNSLIELFSEVYYLGYIFVDSSPNNICYNTSIGKFMLIDFEPHNCYKHRGLIAKEIVIKYNLWIIFSYFLINTQMTHSKFMEYISKLESFADSNLGVDSHLLNYGLQMNRSIGNVGEGGILDELIRHQHIFNKYGNTLSWTFLYYSVVFGMSEYKDQIGSGFPYEFLLSKFKEYSHLTLSEFIEIRYGEKNTIAGFGLKNKRKTKKKQKKNKSNSNNTSIKKRRKKKKKEKKTK